MRITNHDPRNKPSPGAIIDWAHPLANGLLGAWLFAEGVGQKTFSATKRSVMDATLTAATWTNGPGVIGPGIHTASSAYLKVPIPPSTTTFSSFSLVSRGRYTSLPVDSYWLSSRGTSGLISPLGVSNSGTVLAYAWAGSSTTWGWNSGVTIPTNTDRTFVAGSANATNGLVYCNGKNATLTVAGLAATQNWDTDALYLGVDSFNVSSRAIAGNHEYIHFWVNRKLTLDEIRWLEEEPYCFYLPPLSARSFILISSHTYNETMSGGILDGGAATVQAKYNPAITSAGVVVSGSATNTEIYNVVIVAAGVLAGGSASIQETFNPTVSGGVWANGVASVQATYNPIIVAAGVWANGAATVQADYFPAIVAAGVVVSGSATSGETYDEVMNGGILGGGAAEIEVVYNPFILATGAIAGGSAAIWQYFNPSVSGGVWANGAASIICIYNPTIIAAGLWAGGSATVQADYFPFIVAAGVLAGGSASISETFTPTVSGGVVASGAALVQEILNPFIVAAGVLAGGDAVVVEMFATGGVFCGGSAVVTIVVDPALGPVWIIVPSRLKWLVEDTGNIWLPVNTMKTWTPTRVIEGGSWIVSNRSRQWTPKPIEFFRLENRSRTWTPKSPTTWFIKAYPLESQAFTTGNDWILRNRQSNLLARV